MAYMRLGDLLIASGAINNEQLSEALARQKTTGERLGDALINGGTITEAQLIDALRMQLGLDFIDLTAISIPVEMVKFVPRSIARRSNVVPVKFQNDILYIAMSDPLDFVTQEEIKNTSRKRVVPMIATRRATEQAISRLYGNEGTARAIEDMKREAGIETADIIPESMAVNSIDDATAAPTIRFVNSIIERAFDERASDIHVEPLGNDLAVRMRIDGVMQRVLTVPVNLQSSVISRLKIMGSMDITERRIPLDGHATVNIKGHTIDLRISSLPTVYGEKLVIRLLDKSTKDINKTSIGLEGRELEKYESLLHNNSGVILLVGPTGSGKSTTMFAILSQLATEKVNVESLEDPVEYEIPGVNQCQINEKVGMTFANGLRAMLRQDPDIISVGEIRDGETGTIAVRAAITGHLVISTLHTNDAITAVNRLCDLGIERYMVAGSLRGVISQRLVRKVCPHCAEEYEPSVAEKLLLRFNPAENVKFYKGKGCSECNHRGYRGRTAVFEILMVGPEIRRMISEGASDEEVLRVAAEKYGFVSLDENCRDLVRRGVTSAEEALKAISSAEH